MSTLTQTNQYNADKQNLGEKNRDLENQISGISGLVTSSVLTTKIGEVKNKI